MSFEVIASLVLAAVGLYVLLGRSKAPGAPLPPGPKGLPIIGNLLDEPSDGKPWQTYRNWGRQYYSDVIYMNILGQSIVILNSWDACNDLIEKRSNLYSSRPLRVMVYELMGWSNVFAFMPYGDRWREQRKMFTREFTPAATRRYHPQEIAATNTMLNRLIESPDDWLEHLKIQAGQVIMSIAYGFEVKTGKDMFLDVINKALAGLQIAALPGAYMVDVMPFLKHVPSWFPGTGWQRQAADWGQATEDMVELPWKKALEHIAAGTATPSYTSYALEGLDPNVDNTENEVMIKQTAAGIYSAGADTTVAVILVFVLAMLKYPEAQKKAQEELDMVLGHNQLPEFGQEDSLPYCGALVKELYRWRPVSNLAIPRETDTEDVYKGYRIPAKSVILPNAWAILHNKKMFPEPEEFKPERFLKDGKLNTEMMDPTEIGAFGFGRRICPGRFLAQKSVWIAVTSILASMNITKAVDEHGNMIEPSGEQHGAIVNALLPFKCSMKPRSAEVVNVIKSRA